MTARDTVEVTADLLEAMSFDSGLEIIAGPTTMSMKVGRRTFVAPIVPAQRVAGDES